MGTKQYDSATDLITLTRASSATFLGSNGLIQTVTNDAPRIEYNADGTVKGLLIEEARTNLVTNSNDFTAGSWTRQDVSIASNVSGVTAPDGSETVDKIIPNSTSSQHRVWDGVSSTAVGETYSVYAKSAGYDYVWLGYYEGSVYGYAIVNLTNGVVTASNTANYSVEALTNGFYRISVTKTASGTNPRYISISPSPTASPTLASNNAPLYSGDGTSGIYVWGAQLEAGSFPTSYIPTTGATATRARDLARILVTDFGYNKDAGSLVLDVETPLTDQLMILAWFNTTAHYNQRGFVKEDGSGSSGNMFTSSAYDGSGTVLQLPNVGVVSETTKLGLSYKDNEVAVRDGGTVTSGTGRFTSPTQLYIGGRNHAGGYQSQCWIKSVKYYPRKLTDAQLQELTT